MASIPSSDLIKPTPVFKYRRFVAIGDWSGAGPFTFTIPASEHGLSTVGAVGSIDSATVGSSSFSHTVNAGTLAVTLSSPTAEAVTIDIYT